MMQGAESLPNGPGSVYGPLNRNRSKITHANFFKGNNVHPPYPEVKVTQLNIKNPHYHERQWGFKLDFEDGSSQ